MSTLPGEGRLANPAEADANRQAERRLSLSEHAWEIRFEKVLSMIGVIEPGREHA